MASSTPKVILLTVNGEKRPIFEAVADAALTPGELVRFSSDDELQPHGTAAGLAAPMFCVENPYTDPGTTAAIDTDYAIATSARYIWAQPGDIIYAFLADGENVAKGDALMSDGAGALKKFVAYTQAVDEGGAATYTIAVPDRVIVAFADQDLNNSAGGARARIKVRAA